jgi:hypothetical protein
MYSYVDVMDKLDTQNSVLVELHEITSKKLGKFN